MKSEYEFAVKKAVIDFVLGGSLKETYTINEHATEERKGLKEAGTKFKHKYNDFQIYHLLLYTNSVAHIVDAVIRFVGVQRSDLFTLIVFSACL